VLIDARSVAQDSVVRADVCILGGGPAGLTLAGALRSSGLAVLLLESGGRSEGALSDRTSLDLLRAQSVGQTYFPVHTTRVRGLGGTSNHSPEVVRKQGLLNTTFFLDPMSRSRASAAVASVVSLKHALRDRPVPGGLTRHAGNVVRGAPHVARVAGEVLAGRRGRPVAPPVLRQLRCMAEQAPNPLSRVRLDGRRRDALGVPTAVLDWQLSELDRVSLRRAQDVVATAFEAAGLGRITRLLGEEAPAADVRGQWHHMGTTRMAREPRQGVVDPAGRVHGMSNLYVTGSSVFPTSGYANPTLTILALALRLASHLRERPARR
jgi:choline dehydrogenase-like flavoprotein